MNQQWNSVVIGVAHHINIFLSICNIHSTAPACLSNHGPQSTGCTVQGNEMV